jgi:D-sedoheptulose 7-phosphate isomerase
VTALGNDVGFDLVFSRQLIAHGAPGDITVGISTSGSSRNVLTAFAEARTRGMITVGLAGYDGGEMAGAPDLQHCLVVRSDSVHRIQETQAALGFSLWAAVQQRLDDAGG